MSNVADRNVVRLRDRSNEMVDQVAKTVSSMADQLTDSLQNWRSRAKGVATSTDGFVRSSPWQAVGLVALAGLAAGLVVSYGARSVRARRQRANGADYDEMSGG